MEGSIPEYPIPPEICGIRGCAFTKHRKGNHTWEFPITAGIQKLIEDLDTARSTGGIYTYGAVQERLRAILANA